MRLLILIALFFVLSAPAWSAPQKRKLSDSDLGAVIQAVEDEVYDYGYQKDFYHIGENIGTSASAPRTRVRIYIDPEIDAADQSGQIIYKLLPYGEVFRDYTILKNGLVVLAGNPQNGFPQTQESSTKTLYMDDDEVCRMRRDWLRRFFTVDDSPSPSRIHQAAERQKERTGFSDWESRHSPRRNK